jgi:hypothetical protein
MPATPAAGSRAARTGARATLTTSSTGSTAERPGYPTRSSCAVVRRRHHRYLHEHGFTIAQPDGEDGEVAFLDPTGRPIPAVAAVTGVTDDWMDRLRAVLGEAVSAESNLPGWDGEPVDYDRCVGQLC